MTRLAAAAIAIGLTVPGCSFDPSGLDGDPMAPSTVERVECDVVVVGGSTAGLAAALTAARQGADTCLLEPTDWVGGALTAAGDPTSGLARHDVSGLDVASIAADPANLPAEFAAWMADVGNPGGCWQAPHCFSPRTLLTEAIDPTVAGQDNLRVYTETVVKSVETSADGRRITGIEAIRRIPTGDGYASLLSAELPDWYSRAASESFDKEVLQLSAAAFVDASPFGDLLVLSGAAYLQGVEEIDGSAATADDRCGQAIGFSLAAHYAGAPQSEGGNPLPVEHPEDYSLAGYQWDEVWTNRRIVDGGDAGKVADVSVLAWPSGTAYRHGYVFVSRDDAAAQRADWRGGVDLDVLAAAERHANGFYYWFKDAEPQGRASYLTLDRDVFETGSGLSKLPVMHDGRRSIGVGGFVLSSRHLRGDASARTGTRFPDRAALAAYELDVRPVAGCGFTTHAPPTGRATLPSFLPLRALGNRDVDNLVVAGPTMAVSAVAATATSAQANQWSAGIAAGVMVAFVAESPVHDTRRAVASAGLLQARIRDHAPLAWTIDGDVVPVQTDVFAPLALDIRCPQGARYDHGYGFCVDDELAYGPFPRAMHEVCAAEGLAGCDRSESVTIAGQPLTIEAWPKQYVRSLRGDSNCPLGTTPEPSFRNLCVEVTTVGSGQQVDVFGPFGEDLARACEDAGGGDACSTQRWSADLFLNLID